MEQYKNEEFVYELEKIINHFDKMSEQKLEKFKQKFEEYVAKNSLSEEIHQLLNLCSEFSSLIGGYAMAKSIKQNI